MDGSVPESEEKKKKREKGSVVEVLWRYSTERLRRFWQMNGEDRRWSGGF